jgi:mRNA-degrading endonuclease RelE of RelBE toxin-antitoxin system
MAERFSVRTTPRFDRFAKALGKQNKEFIARYREAIAIFAEDPYNHGRAHRIKKLVAIQPGEGQWRLRLGRWRFRYDIEASEVVLTLAVCATRARIAKLACSMLTIGM